MKDDLRVGLAWAVFCTLVTLGLIWMLKQGG